MNANSKRLLVAVAIAAAAAVFACVLFFFDPMTSAFYPRCPSKLLTGYDCPGCGTTRALHALVHLDFGAALRYNAALFVLGPLLLLYAAAVFTAPDSAGPSCATSSCPSDSAFGIICATFSVI